MLVEDLPAAAVMADAAYDSNRLRERTDANGRRFYDLTDAVRDVGGPVSSAEPNVPGGAASKTPGDPAMDGTSDTTNIAVSIGPRNIVTIARKGAVAAIPNNPSRAAKHPLDKHLYAQRHLIECRFSKLKQFRRVATRFEKTAKNYLAIVTLAAIVLWLR